MRLPLLVSAGVVVVFVLSACAPSPTPASPGATTTASATSGSPSPVPSSSGPVILAFQIIDDVSCSGSQASVPVSWLTRDAQSVAFEVDGQPVSAGAGHPVSGIGNVAVPCDGREHRVVLVASGEGSRVSVARHVNTSTSAPPSGAPSISRFDLLDDVSCSGQTVEVPAAWTTQSTQAVNFSVDGQPLPAAAGFSVSGVGNIPVPCDGNAHKVTLTATGTGASASLSRSVNTTVSSSGGTTGTATPTTTAVPTTSPTTR
jgi:hypothetical protein